MYLFQSLIVFIFLLAIVIVLIIGIVKQRKTMGKRYRKLKNIFAMVISLVVSLICLFSFGQYVYPFDRTIDPKLYIVAPMPETYQSSFPGQKFWHGAYDKSFPYSESPFFDPTSISKYGVPLPFLDFKNHSYIFTYGQEIEKLSYNIWDVIDTPFESGSLAGKIEFSEDFISQTMYIYEIPPIRIDNDLNNTVDRTHFSSVFWNVVICCSGNIFLVFWLLVKNRRGQTNY